MLIGAPWAHYYFPLPNSVSVESLSGEISSILWSVSFKNTNWQAYSPLFWGNKIIRLKFSLGIDSSSDHLYVCLESLPQTSARTLKTTHMSRHLLSKRPRPFRILGVLVIPSDQSATAPLVSVDPRREQKWVPGPSRISVYPVVLLHVHFLSWVTTTLALTEG